MCHSVTLLFFFIFATSGETKLQELLFFALLGELNTRSVQPVKSCGFLQKTAVVRTDSFCIKQFLCSELCDSYLIVLLGPRFQGLKLPSIKSELQVPRNPGKVTCF